MGKVKRPARVTPTPHKFRRTITYKKSAPISSYNAFENPHGVSGFENTGVAGNYSFQFQTPIQAQASVDPSTSGYGFQNRANMTPLEGRTTMDYNPPGGNIATPEPNVGMNLVTPPTEGEAPPVISSRGKTLDQVAGLVAERSSLMSEHITEGYGHRDPAVQALMNDADDATPTEFVEPLLGGGHVPIPPPLTVGNQQLEQPTQNATHAIQPIGPDNGQEAYHQEREQRTRPAIVNNGHTNPANHVSHGMGMSAGHSHISLNNMTQQDAQYPYLALGVPPDPINNYFSATEEPRDVTVLGMRGTGGPQIQFEL